MRLHWLCMTAIGPFAERAELDLDRFGDAGLFLIEGQTGAGKSTILDAISFALYGKPAQSSTTLERLKSHHAPAGTEPAVELVFETQSGRYRIRRTPSYDRPKKRGAGTTPMRMTVRLYRLTGADTVAGGELISHNLADVEDEITRAVGLSHTQFVQTVLLPQGEFASFLSAKTEVKRALLQRLFGTELLDRTQTKLVEGRAAAEKARRAAVETVRDAVHAFAGSVALAEAELAELLVVAESGDADRVPGQLAASRRRLQDEVTDAAGRLSVASRRRAAADRVVQAETVLADRRALRATLREQLRRLLAQAEQYEAGQAELAAAERALTVRPAFEAARAAVGALDRARQVAATARTRLPEPLADAAEPALRTAAASRHGTLGSLADELRRELTLADRVAELDQLAAEQAARQAGIERAEALLAELPGQQRELAETHTAAQQAAAQLAGLVAERDRAAARLVAARQAETAAREAAEEKQLVQELFDAEQRAEQKVLSLRTAWRANIASELGLALQAGDPCSVCGSLEHPKPARPSADHVSQEQLQRAEDELGRLTGAVQGRKTQLAELQASLVQLQVAADQLSPELAEATLTRASTALAGAQQAADQLPVVEQALARLRREQAELQEQVRTADAERAALAERCTGLRRAIDSDQTRLAQARAGHGSVADRVAALREELAAIEAAAAAAADQASALAAAEAAGELFSGALTAADFGDQQAWQQAERSSARLAELRQELRGYAEQLARVQARLAADELIDPALDDEPAELTELVAAAAAAEAEEQAAAGRHGAAQDRLAIAGELSGRLERAVRKGAEVLERTAPAIRIGNLVSGLGDNQLKMELTTYVLIRRFAEVLAAANTQLHRISQGRYQLEHTDARTGNARSGLNLRVLDLHTGRPRDPATLSGGETFYVSLALALGLADVVRAESGGIDLGTLFIDEGFGTLDAEVLDGVISVLDSLRQGGRAVGIVSHVSELKMRIADQIRVIRNVDGTSRLQVTG
ncbi:MAG: AAA family ATPase [Jatrophihabitantaceae bacterium]